jgi:hypothetical protein
VDPALSELARPIEDGQPWPRPACPKCQTGYIGFSAPTEDEGHDSASARNHPAFEPEWISGTFVVRGQCENPECRQAVHGTATIAWTTPTGRTAMISSTKASPIPRTTL